jgi:hypothetical protein
MNKRGKLGIGFISLGSVIVIFALIWISIIEPRFEKLPTDLDETWQLDGSIALVSPKVNVPVSIQRHLQATSVEDGVLIIQDITDSTPNYLNSSSTLGVSRSSRKFVPGYGDRERSALWAYPIGVKKKTYSLWSDTAGRPTDAHFVGKEKVGGLEVYLFNTDEKNLAFDTRTLDISRFVSPTIKAPFLQDMVIDEKIEPNTGLTVDFKSVKMISGTSSTGEKTLVATITQQYTNATVTDKISDAKHHKTQLLWATKYGLWIGIGSGILCLITGVALIVRSKRVTNPS